MKKIKFMAMALAVLTIVSCSKEDVQAPGNGDGEGGGKAYATFSIKLSDTKALDDPAGTEIENKITDCRVLIYYEGGQFEKEVIFAPGATTAEPVQITTGPKTIVTIINGASRNLTSKELDHTTKLANATLSEIANAQSGTDVLMTSQMYKEDIQVKGGMGNSPENPIKISMKVNRAVAKTFVRENVNNIQLTGKLTDKATLVSTDFAINGTASYIAVSQLVNASGLIKNHSSMSVIFLPIVSSPELKLTYSPVLTFKDTTTLGTPLLENIVGNTFVDISGATIPTLNKQATMIYIKAKITPKANFSGTEEAITGGATYYRMEMVSGDMLFFKTADEAQVYITATAGHINNATTPKDNKVYEHLTGYNYYRVLFKHLKPGNNNYSTMVYSVVRNNIYNVSIDNITNWGAANDGIDLVDPEKPIENIALVKAEIVVSGWTVNRQFEDL